MHTRYRICDRHLIECDIHVSIAIPLNLSIQLCNGARYRSPDLPIDRLSRNRETGNQQFKE